MTFEEFSDLSERAQMTIAVSQMLAASAGREIVLPGEPLLPPARGGVPRAPHTAPAREVLDAIAEEGARARHGRDAHTLPILRKARA